ncbi:hypothetical protein [Micromonospora sonneratiae]|uniref:Uncharacterized protein n=1 Tax=Micromonospora sonneratiae TaxID=1184706 RepID=A0ABW3YR08_9ACTN
MTEPERGASDSPDHDAYHRRYGSPTPLPGRAVSGAYFGSLSHAWSSLNGFLGHLVSPI